MNLSLLPFSLTAIAPVIALLGAGAITALSLVIILGVSAMLLRDYRPVPTYHTELARTGRHQQSLPLAA